MGPGEGNKWRIMGPGEAQTTGTYVPVIMGPGEAQIDRLSSGFAEVWLKINSGSISTQF